MTTPRHIRNQPAPPITTRYNLRPSAFICGLFFLIGDLDEGDDYFFEGQAAVGDDGFAGQYAVDLLARFERFQVGHGWFVVCFR